MATLTTQPMISTGLAPSYQAAAGGGDALVPSSTTFLHVINGGGSPVTVTLVTPGVVDGDLAIADRAITVTNGTNKMIPVSPETFRDPATGLATITYSAVTSVTVAAIAR